MNAFRNSVRALAVIALVTGAGDLAIGLAGQQTIGAALAEGYGDPLLNSQIRFLGSIWFGFGWLLWTCSADVPRHAKILRGALLVVFLGGIGRILSVVQFGFPPSGSGTFFVILATAIEILGMPPLLVWLGRLQTGSESRMSS